jgi:hypothetical protein
MIKRGAQCAMAPEILSAEAGPKSVLNYHGNDAFALGNNYSRQ